MPLNMNVALTAPADSFSNSPPTISSSTKETSTCYSSMLSMANLIEAYLTAPSLGDRKVQGEQ